MTGGRLAGKARAPVSGKGDMLVLAKVFERAGGWPIPSLDAFSRLHSFDRLVP